MEQTQELDRHPDRAPRRRSSAVHGSEIPTLSLLGSRPDFFGMLVVMTCRADGVPMRQAVLKGHCDEDRSTWKAVGNVAGRHARMLRVACGRAGS
jgi:hypothetical protein